MISPASHLELLVPDGLSAAPGQTADISDVHLSPQSHKTERVHGHVLEPCKISVHVDMAKGTGDVRLQISDVHIRVSPDVLELGASLQASVLEPLIQPSADRYHTLKSRATALQQLLILMLPTLV